MCRTYTLYKGRMCGIFMDRGQIGERLASAASMPKDVVIGATVVTVLGDFEVCIGNYRGITEYTEELVRVQTKGGQIRLTGRQLQVEYYTNDEMKVTGKILTLEFINGRKEE